MKTTYILGINAFHADSSACILKDGVVVAAIEEERIKRIKHWAGFPEEAIRFCLSEAGIQVTELDHVAISRDPKANLGKKILHTLKNRVKVKAIVDRVQNLGKVSSVQQLLANATQTEVSGIRAVFHQVEHHRSHLASAFFASPFEKAALLSIDGFGDFSSTMTATGTGNQMEVHDTVSYPHSLGIMYTAFTQYLGFGKYGDEYKVMGLAPYGKPEYLDQLDDVIHMLDNGLFELNLSYFRHAKEGVEMNWEGGEPSIGSIYSEVMEKAFGPARKREDELTQHHMNLASSLQRKTEQVIFHMATALQRKTGLKQLCLAGGVAQNSVANGKILAQTPFDELYVPPAGHDAGTSFGAALYVHNQVLKSPRVEAVWSAATGSRFRNEDVEACLKKHNLNFEKLEDDVLYDKVSECLLDGGVVGWFQGRAEFGPRALGHRSILCDPRRADAKDILNLKIKKRESFRPFAPSILAEYKDEYFEGADQVPFMEKVYVIKEDMRKKIPAVTHVDGTGRLQTVDKVHNKRYHHLISAFYKKSGVPIILNTSFNENEPIVNTPEEALQCYLRTSMDMIVLENYLVSR
ncbi:MAG: hypothetical protein KDD36_08320 [Flavobacteriales bacterium]|nr:hypothetical protein [Flavobacteriales bacterium]